LYETIFGESDPYSISSSQGAGMKKMKAIKTIITPIDFSDNAGLVVESAAYMAEKFGAALHIIFVVQNFEDYSGFFVPQMNVPNIEHELFVGAEEQMKSFCREHGSYFEKAGISVIDKVLVGDVAEKIVEYAALANGDLIVMGTHGYKGLERIMFGSVADKVVKSAPCPVMTINPYTCCD
jgi:nucleotide-binding universal stress UspA family protein